MTDTEVKRLEAEVRRLRTVVATSLWPQYPFTDSEYRLVLSVLHQPHNCGAERLAAAYHLFKAKEDQLRQPPADAAAPRRSAPLPASTAEAWLAQRRTKTR